METVAVSLLSLNHAYEFLWMVANGFGESNLKIFCFSQAWFETVYLSWRWCRKPLRSRWRHFTPNDFVILGLRALDLNYSKIQAIPCCSKWLLRHLTVNGWRHKHRAKSQRWALKLLFFSNICTFHKYVEVTLQHFFIVCQCVQGAASCVRKKQRVLSALSVLRVTMSTMVKWNVYVSTASSLYLRTIDKILLSHLLYITMALLMQPYCLLSCSSAAYWGFEVLWERPLSWPAKEAKHGEEVWPMLNCSVSFYS